MRAPALYQLALHRNQKQQTEVLLLRLVVNPTSFACFAHNFSFSALAHRRPQHDVSPETLDFDRFVLPTRRSLAHENEQVRVLEHP